MYIRVKIIWTEKDSDYFRKTFKLSNIEVNFIKRGKNILQKI